MARDITTTYNSWSFDEDRLNDIQDAIEGQNQQIPEKSEITLPKLQFGISKEFSLNNEYSLLGAFDLFVVFEETNDIVSTEIASINPALGFELGYIDLVYLRLGVGNFQNEIQYDSSEKLSFQPNFGIGFNMNSIEINYAFTDIGNQSTALYSNIFLWNSTLIFKMNKTYINILFALALIFFSLNIYANELENKNRYKISILSIGEGPSLVDAFGHTAIRVKDAQLKNDIVFNFGVYDFNSPNFYSNFVKGRPEYKLAYRITAILSKIISDKKDI